MLKHISVNPNQSPVLQALWRGASRRGVITTGLLCTLCFIGFAPLISQFEAASGGLLPLDMQAGLSEAGLRSQLNEYTPEVAQRYQYFALLDLIFPPLFSLFFCLLWGALMRHYWAAKRLSSLCLLAFLSCAFDWAENLSQWLLIQQQLGGEGLSQQLMGLSLAAKHAKFAAVISNAGVALILALAGQQLKRRQLRQ